MKIEAVILNKTLPTLNINRSTLVQLVLNHSVAV